MICQSTRIKFSDGIKSKSRISKRLILCVIAKLDYDFNMHTEFVILSGKRGFSTWIFWVIQRSFTLRKSISFVLLTEYTSRNGGFTTTKHKAYWYNWKTELEAWIKVMNYSLMPRDVKYLTSFRGKNHEEHPIFELVQIFLLTVKFVRLLIC